MIVPQLAFMEAISTPPPDVGPSGHAAASCGANLSVANATKVGNETRSCTQHSPRAQPLARVG